MLPALQTFGPPNLRLLLLRSPILNNSIVLFFGTLNKLNSLIACHKLELTDNA